MDLSNGGLHIRVFPASGKVQIPVRRWGLEKQTSVYGSVAANCATLVGIDYVWRACQITT